MVKFRQIWSHWSLRETVCESGREWDFKDRAGKVGERKKKILDPCNNWKNDDLFVSNSLFNNHITQVKQQSTKKQKEKALLLCQSQIQAVDLIREYDNFTIRTHVWKKQHDTNEWSFWNSRKDEKESEKGESKIVREKYWN